MLGLVFQVGPDKVAVDVRRVREVVPRVRLTAVQGAPPWIAGVFVYRGRVVPVVDLHALAGVGECPLHLSSRIILFPYPLDVPEALVGLLATQVAEIREIRPGIAQPIPGPAGRPSLGPALADGEGILRLLDPDWMLSQVAAGSGGLIEAGFAPVTPRAIETVVRERLGLDPSALGPNVLDRAVEARMHARGLHDAALYTARLMTEAAERDALAADLAVSETWFFRGGRGLFDRLAAFVTDRAATKTAGGTARVLSVPCSTGEEPYSLAIALHERFLTPNEFTIDAVDLSGRALGRATTARFGAFAFREGGADLRPVYFRAVENEWELLPHLRAVVRFLPGNLTDPLFLADERPYDLILCRNLFIYLTADARMRATANFDRLLALDGRLCVTPAEADRLPPGRFVLDGPMELGIYRRVGVGSAIHKVLPARVEATEPNPTTTPLPPPLASVPVATDPLGTARLLADTGRLDEARTACEALIRARPTNADALALLGVVHLAAGRAAEAFDALRKALYLAPDHIEAMEHMMALCERRGDATRAAALRKRLARLALKEES